MYLGGLLPKYGLPIFRGEGRGMNGRVCDREVTGRREGCEGDGKEERGGT